MTACLVKTLGYSDEKTHGAVMEEQRNGVIARVAHGVTNLNDGRPRRLQREAITALADHLPFEPTPQTPCAASECPQNSASTPAR